MATEQVGVEFSQLFICIVRCVATINSLFLSTCWYSFGGFCFSSLKTSKNIMCEARTVNFTFYETTVWVILHRSGRASNANQPPIDVKTLSNCTKVIGAQTTWIQSRITL